MMLKWLLFAVIIIGVILMARGYPDFEGGKSGIYSKAEWAVKEGIDKTFYATADVIVPGEGRAIAYAVPAGKTLYLTDFGFKIKAANVADADNNQMGSFLLYNTIAAVSLAAMGGNGGGFGPFLSPRKIPGGQAFTAKVFNHSNHDAGLAVFVAGFEI